MFESLFTTMKNILRLSESQFMGLSGAGHGCGGGCDPKWNGHNGRSRTCLVKVSPVKVRVLYQPIAIQSDMSEAQTTEMCEASGFVCLKMGHFTESSNALCPLRSSTHQVYP
jgi:hypothetical protein